MSCELACKCGVMSQKHFLPAGVLSDELAVLSLERYIAVEGRPPSQRGAIEHISRPVAHSRLFSEGSEPAELCAYAMVVYSVSSDSL